MVPAVAGLAGVPPASHHRLIFEDRQADFGGQQFGGANHARTTPASAAAILIAWIVHA